MFKIAICGSDIEVSKQLKQMISMLNTTKHGECLSSILIYPSIFVSVMQLKEELLQGEIFDLVILDIAFDALDTLSFAKWMRYDMNDRCTDILFISDKQSCIMNIFEVQPINFLLKPLHRNQVLQSIHISMAHQQKKEIFFSFTYKKQHFRLPFREIRYFESRDKKIMVHSIHGEQECYGKISDIVEQVPRSDFIMIHQSFLVQWDYIRIYKANCIILDNAVQLPISRACQKAVKESYLMLTGKTCV